MDRFLNAFLRETTNSFPLRSSQYNTPLPFCQTCQDGYLMLHFQYESDKFLICRNASINPCALYGRQ